MGVERGQWQALAAFVARIADLNPELGPMDIQKLVKDAQALSVAMAAWGTND